MNSLWILCRNRLPQYHECYEVTVQIENKRYSMFRIFNPVNEKWYFLGSLHEFDDKNQIIAWKEHTPPYEDKEDVKNV